MLAATLNAVKHGFYRRRGEDAGTCRESLKEGNLPEGFSRPVFKKSGRVSGKSKVGSGEEKFFLW